MPGNEGYSSSDNEEDFLAAGAEKAIMPQHGLQGELNAASEWQHRASWK